MGLLIAFEYTTEQTTLARTAMIATKILLATVGNSASTMV